MGLYPLELEGQIDFFVGIEERLSKAPRSSAERLAFGATRLAVTTHVGRNEELQLATSRSWQTPTSAA
jgi:predicted transcriptional regulator YdeE